MQSPIGGPQVLMPGGVFPGRVAPPRNPRTMDVLVRRKPQRHGFARGRRRFVGARRPLRRTSVRCRGAPGRGLSMTIVRLYTPAADDDWRVTIAKMCAPARD